MPLNPTVPPAYNFSAGFQICGAREISFPLSSPLHSMSLTLHCPHFNFQCFKKQEIRIAPSNDGHYTNQDMFFCDYELDLFCQIWHKRTIFKFYGRIADSSILGFCLWIRAARIGVSTNGILLQNLPMYVHPFGKDDFGIYISHILLLSDPLYTLQSKCCWLLLTLCTFHAVAVSSCCWCCCYVVYVYVYIVDFVGSCLRWQYLFLLAMFVFVGNVC